MGKFAEKNGPASRSKNKSEEKKEEEEKEEVEVKRTYVLSIDTIEKIALMDVRTDMNKSEIVSKAINELYDKMNK